jgi:hypothetical protein
MILLVGIPSEPPLEMVHDALRELGAPVLMLNQRDATESSIRLRSAPDPDLPIEGELVIRAERVPLDAITGVYARPMDDTMLPELVDEPEGSPVRARVRTLHDLLMRWFDVAPGVIVNRPSPMASNGSKPYQTRLIAQAGLHVPETLVTDDPAAARSFLERHTRVIFKSVSGVRSIVREFTPEDAARLELVRTCPVQFQAYVPGVDVRVHVIGERVFATRAITDRTDYRYAARQGGSTELEATTLDADLEARCIKLAADLGLDFAGIDLRIDDDGQAVCFEVNPCPAYSYYQANTGQPIAQAVAEHLVRGMAPTSTPPQTARAPRPARSSRRNAVR